MSVSDAASLVFWLRLYSVGEGLVILGVVMEGIEIWWRRVVIPRQLSRSEIPTDLHQEPKWVKTVGDFGWLVLVIGLFIAFVSYKEAEFIQMGQIKDLTAQLKDAVNNLDSTKRDVGRLSLEAAKFNDRASSNELAVAIVQSNNVALQYQLLMARRELNELHFERMPKWMRFHDGHFEDALKGKPKIDIEILYSQNDNDSFRLAESMRMGFQRADWKVSGPRPLSESDIEPRENLLFAGSPLLDRAHGFAGMYSLSTNWKLIPWETNGPILAVVAALGAATEGVDPHRPKGTPFFDWNFWPNATVPDNTLRIIVP